MATLQRVSEDLGVERLGHKTKDQEPTNSNKRPRMMHQIVRKDARKVVKKYAKRQGVLKGLKERLGTFRTLLLMCEKRGL